MPGFVLSAKDHSKLSERYLCGLCNKLVRDPLQAKCGHLFCGICVDTALTVSRGSAEVCCAKDGNPLYRNQMFPDNFIKQEILQLRVFVHCTNNDEGCLWQGKLEDYEEHTQTCQFETVTCDYAGCMVKFTRSKREEHMQECGLREVCCSGCGDTYFTRDMQAHKMGDCPVFPVVCPRCGKTGIPRAELPNHSDAQMGDCEALKSQCQFQQFGCPVNQAMVPLAKTQHDTDFTSKHLEWLMVVQMQGAKVKIEPPKANEEARATNTYPQSFESRMEEIENRHEQLSLQLLHERETSANLRQVIATQAARMTRLEEHVHKFNEPSRSDGVLLWKIDNFKQKKETAQSVGTCTYLQSPCFYTGRRGYKLCARIYLNGDGMGKGSDISLFLVIMKGEYDNLLDWPFKYNVTLMILDQKCVPEHVIYTIRPDQSSSFQKPKREMNVASGCPQFLPLTELNNSGYVKDDVMFVKAMVELGEREI